MKIIHTHRGHCQLCTMVQAIDPVTGLVAKHGYTVAYGYFSGTCPASGKRSLHVEMKLAAESIRDALVDAAALGVFVNHLRAGTKHPTKVHGGEYTERDARGRREAIMVPWDQGTEAQQRTATSNLIYETEGRIRQCQHHARDLTEWVDKIFEKVPAYQVKDLEPRDWEKGDTIRLGGKGRDGFDCIIEEIELRPMQTHGWRKGDGGVSVKHGRVTRPARPEKRAKPTKAYPEGCVITEARTAKTWWEPLRNIKRPATTLAEQLKKDGKL